MSSQQTFMPDVKEKPASKKKKKGKYKYAIVAEFRLWGKTHISKYDCLEKAQQALQAYESKIYYTNVKIVEI